jgi:hypothetical protein
VGYAQCGFMCRAKVGIPPQKGNPRLKTEAKGGKTQLELIRSKCKSILFLRMDNTSSTVSFFIFPAYKNITVPHFPHCIHTTSHLNKHTTLDISSTYPAYTPPLLAQHGHMGDGKQYGNVCSRWGQKFGRGQGYGM